MTPTSHANRLQSRLRQWLGDWSPALRSYLLLVAIFSMGYAAGTIAGSVIERGLGLTYSRIAPAPVFSATRLLAWGIAFLLASCIWRVPRLYLIARHRLHWMSAFAASFSMAIVSYLLFVLLDQFEIAGDMADLLFVFAFIVPAIAAVELEVFLVRWLDR